MLFNGSNLLNSRRPRYCITANVLLPFTSPYWQVIPTYPWGHEFRFLFRFRRNYTSGISGSGNVPESRFRTPLAKRTSRWMVYFKSCMLHYYFLSISLIPGLHVQRCYVLSQEMKAESILHIHACVCFYPLFTSITKHSEVHIILLSLNCNHNIRRRCPIQPAMPSWRVSLCCVIVKHKSLGSLMGLFIGCAAACRCEKECSEELKNLLPCSTANSWLPRNAH